MKFKNYLFELYPDFPQDFDIKSIKEVDKVSNDLYDDLKKAFFDDNALKKIGLDNITKKLQNVGNGPYYTLFADEDKFLLSADYIGASIYWAKKAGLSDIEIISYLFISRTIGGHIVFPRGNGVTTVNQARGGEPQTKGGRYKGYYDRFDLTLYAIKHWFARENFSKINYAIDNYKEWFELFINDIELEDGFKNFINFFYLEDFVSENLEIIDLVNSDLKNNKKLFLDKEDISIPSTRESYLQYVINSNIIIWKRTKKLLEK